MKNKTKVVLGLTAVLAGTVGVAGVSTFAWFTTNNLASVNFADAHVVSDNASIVVQYEGLLNNGIAPELVTAGKDIAGSAVTVAGASINVRDVSGDGNHFYRPTGWDVYQTTAKGFSSLTLNDFSATKTYWVTFGVAVTNKGAADTKVFLGHASSVAGKTGATRDVRSANATRVAIWSDDTTAGQLTTLKTIWQRDNTDHAAGYKYVSAASTGTSAYGVDAFQLSTPDAATFHEGDFASVASYDAVAASGQEVVTFDTQNQTKHLTISMWIEGTLSLATDDCIGGDVALTLSLEAYEKAAF